MGNIYNLISSVHQRDRFSHPFSFMEDIQNSFAQRELFEYSKGLAGVNVVMKSMVLQNKVNSMNGLNEMMRQISENPLSQFRNTMMDSVMKIATYKSQMTEVFGKFLPHPAIQQNHKKEIERFNEEFQSAVLELTEEAVATDNIQQLQNIEELVSEARDIATDIGSGPVSEDYLDKKFKELERNKKRERVFIILMTLLTKLLYDILRPIILDLLNQG